MLCAATATAGNKPKSLARFVQCRYICDDILNTESVACSRIANVGNSNEERRADILPRHIRIWDIGVGLLLILSSRFPTTCNSKNKYSAPRFLLHLAQTVEQGAERQKTKLMKKILLSVIMITFGMCTYAQNSIKIPVGKNIPVTLTSEIYSNSRASQQVSATVSNDIKADDGTVVIRRGTPVNINAEIKKAKGVGKGASVRLDIISTTAVDGQTIYLQGLFQRHGDDRKRCPWSRTWNRPNSIMSSRIVLFMYKRGKGYHSGRDYHHQCCNCRCI